MALLLYQFIKLHVLLFGIGEPLTTIFNLIKSHVCRDFPRPDFLPGPFPIQKGAKNSQNSVYHSQFLSSTFRENFMKSEQKIAKLQMHENLHKNVTENVLSFTFLKLMKNCI